jgi:hypothetical protein
MSWIRRTPETSSSTACTTQIKAVSPLPVKFVDQHATSSGSTSGNNQKFIDAGAQVVALEALKTVHGERSENDTDSRTPHANLRERLGPEAWRREAHLHFYGRGPHWGRPRWCTSRCESA